MSAEVIRRRNLPHWDVPCAAYFVTVCLHGSIPARGLLDIIRHREELNSMVRPASTSPAEWKTRLWKQSFVRVEQWLDGEPAVRHLERPELACIVRDAMYYFAGERYDLLAFVVMPSHFHWVFQPLQSWVSALGTEADVRTPRERIMQSVNRYSSRECNRLLQQQGTFWQHECYDHWIRDVDELERIIRYIEANPSKAGLVTDPCEWLYSSAHDRKLLGLEFGVPLQRTVSGTSWIETKR